MKIYCTIVVDDAKQREQVCECANRLGGAKRIHRYDNCNYDRMRGGDPTV